MNRLLRFCFVSLSALLISGFAYAQPVADFTASAVSGCPGLIVEFTDASTGSPTSWNWDFGDGSANSVVQNPVHTYSNQGSYTVILTATNGSGSNTITKTAYITIYGKPSFNFSASPVNGCLPLNVSFSSSISALNGPGPASYSWDFGDGTASGTTANPAHTYTSAGPFKVELTVANAAGCAFTVSKANYITPYESPVGSFTTSNQDLCSPPDTVTFTNTSTSSAPGTLSTTWIFGDGSPNGTGTTNSHVYTSGGPTFTVTMITTDSRTCATTITKTNHIFIYTTPATFTISQNPVCENKVVTFTNTTSGHLSSNWDFGDGVLGTGTNVTHNYTVAGTYTVTLTTGIGPCTKTLSQQIVVLPNPVTTITRSPNNPCPVGQDSAFVTFTATSTTPGAGFSWNFGDGSPGGTGSPVSHTYTSNGYKTIVVTTTNPVTGCQGTADMVDMPIHSLKAKITASPQADCVPLISTFGVDLFSHLPPPPPPGPDPPYPEAAVTWNWTFNDKAPNPPGTSTSGTPTYTWNDKGTYLVKVTGTTANGCKFADSMTVHADEPVFTDFSATPLVVCPKDTVRFTNLAANVSNTTYHWELGDTSFTTLTYNAGFYYLYKTPGSYTVELITDHLGCVAKKTRTNYIVVNPSNAAFAYTVDCPPSLTARFSDMSVGATSWTWNFGDGSPVSNLQNPVHTYAALGNYQVTLTTSNSVFGCTDNITKTVAVADPVLDIDSDKDTICLGETVGFLGSFSGPTAVTYAWIIGNNQVTPYSTSEDYQYTFNTRGSYDVKLVTISGHNGNCYDTLLYSNYILVAQPIVNYTATPTLDCAPFNATFTDLSSAVLGTNIVNRSWHYGEGGQVPTTSTNTTHTYLFPGKYTTKLFLTDNVGCQDSLVKTDYIEARKPFVDFDAPKLTLCTNEGLTFTNSSVGVTPLTYRWDFGDGQTDTARFPTHRWNTPGVYTVTLTTYDITPCSTSKVRTAYVTVVGPTAGFTMDKTVAICPPLNINFTNTSIGAATYSWDMGTGSAPLVVENPIYSYSTPGLYRIILKATDTNGCFSLDTGYAHMLGYNGAFTYTPADACAPQEVQFSTSIAGIPKITWDFGDGNVAVTTTNHTVSHTYITPGTYRPRAVFSDGAACNAVDSGTVPIRIDKVDANFSTSVPCVGAPFTLTDGSTALFSLPSNWRWLFTPLDTAVGSNPSYTFSTPGPHPVRLIVTTNWGCKDTIIKDVFINDLPKVDAGPADTGICPGDTILLTGRGAIDYTWGPDSLVSCINCPATWVSKAEPPTTYYLRGVDANGCINYDSIRARIQIQTTSQVMPGGEICIGDTFRLFAYGANFYSWEPIEFLDSPYINSPLAKPIITTTYVVTAKEGTCLERKDSVTVVVHPLPIFDAGPEEWINYGSAITLQPTEKNIARIEWRPDTTLSCLDCFHPIARPPFTNIYYATAYSDFGCVSTDSVMVKVRCNGDSVYIPNTFTPNGDGKNDVFYPRGKGVTFMSNMRIYNRWGEMVFERSEQFPLNVESMGWDGTFKGKQLPPDVYVYTMSTRCPTGEPLNFKGDISLVR